MGKISKSKDEKWEAEDFDRGGNRAELEGLQEGRTMLSVQDVNEDTWTVVVLGREDLERLVAFGQMMLARQQ